MNVPQGQKVMKTMKECGSVFHVEAGWNRSKNDASQYFAKCWSLYPLWPVPQSITALPLQVPVLWKTRRLWMRVIWCSHRRIAKMNIYDTRPIRCVICQKAIGEVDFDAEIIRPKCGQCANPILDTKDKMPYLIYHWFSILWLSAKSLIHNRI